MSGVTLSDGTAVDADQKLQGAPRCSTTPWRRCPAYTAPTAAAGDRFAEFADAWAGQYPAVIKLWRSAWEEFIPFLDYAVEIRRIICSTNASESLNARYRRAVRARGHFPTEQVALKRLYLVTRSLDPTDRGRARWAMRWKPALNAFAITFDGRIVPSGLNEPNGQLHRSSDTPPDAVPPTGFEPDGCGSAERVVVDGVVFLPGSRRSRLPQVNGSVAFLRSPDGAILPGTSLHI